MRTLTSIAAPAHRKVGLLLIRQRRPQPPRIIRRTVAICPNRARSVAGAAYAAASSAAAATLAPLGRRRRRRRRRRIGRVRFGGRHVVHRARGRGGRRCRRFGGLGFGFLRLAEALRVALGPLELRRRQALARLAAAVLAHRDGLLRVRDRRRVTTRHGASFRRFLLIYLSPFTSSTPSRRRWIRDSMPTVGVEEVFFSLRDASVRGDDGE